MAEIVCIECKSTVSDESGSCPECGYPFDAGQGEPEAAAAESETSSEQPQTVVTTPLDVIIQSINAVGLEIKALQTGVIELQQGLHANLASSESNSARVLADIVNKLDAITLVQSSIKTALQPDPAKNTKKDRLAAFYKTLNSPNSMFEYMFYICVMQIIFVIVILFLAAYIVTLVRE